MNHDDGLPDHLQQVIPPIILTTSSDELVEGTPHAPAVGIIKNYDVFISHRGPDTKKTLVDVLHENFTSKGFTCFVDYEGIEPGDGSWASIHSAIHHSKVHVIVLSQQFAKSEWCLKEVHEIMQLCRSILPVFYDIEPGDVRSSVTELKASASHASKWADALLKLSYISGFRLDQTSKFLGKLATRIVSRVSELIGNPAFLYVDPVLVDQYHIQTEEAEKLIHLSVGSKPVGSLGIVGVPQVGKSTVAKLLYQKLHKQFQASSILLDVRESAKSSGGLAELQGRLLKDLVREDMKIYNTGQGRNLLFDSLQNIKCLIIIDDIDSDLKQLTDLLVKDKDRLGRGSCLVLTSRFQKVIGWAGVDKTLTLTNNGLEAQLIAISYVGVDVYQGFIDHLVESLSTLGLSVCLQKGALLTAALINAQTKLLLVVLSKSYLASPQLLDEVNEVSSDVVIVPIFYGLETHEEEHLLESTRLRRVSNEALLHYSIDLDNPIGFKRMAFKSLIHGVANLFDQHKYAKVDVAKYPVGLIERQRQVEMLISNISHSGVRCVGLVGMGGVGKTTLVKALYNNIHKRFEGSVLLLNVRAEVARARLQELQKEIIKGVMGHEVGVQSVEEGSRLLSHRLAGTTTLIILDDVDDRPQLDALFTPLVLGPGSLVIITSRNRDILLAADVEEIHEVELLCRSHSEMLFYWHAFLRPYAPADVQHLANKVIDACHGLPLSLEITAAHIYNHSLDVNLWEETILHLTKNAHDIFGKLRISVDTLDPNTRTAFLDVACCLIGEGAETAVRLWTGCGWEGYRTLEVLKNKCLVKVDSTTGILGMHDQIRDMGRYMVAENDRPLHTRSHIWDEEDATKFLQTVSRGQGIGMDAVRGLRCWNSWEQRNSWMQMGSIVGIRWLRWISWNAKAFCGLSQLKLLFLSGEVDIDFYKFGDQIKWLQWHNCYLYILPPGLRELSVLDLSGSDRLKALWRGSKHSDSEVHPRKLLELNLSGCSGLKELPHFDPYLLRLQCLNLQGCSRLRELHTSIGCSTSLEFLDLSSCEELQVLPDEIKGLKKLRRFLLRSCKSLERLPETIGHLTSLEFLDLSECWNLQFLPDEIKGLKNLRRFLLYYTSLKRLPETIGHLTSLEFLDLSECKELQCLPDEIKGLKNLRSLQLEGVSLRSLPETICQLRNLTELNLCSCTTRTLPESFGELESLERLDLRHCCDLVSLPLSVGGLKMLKFCNMSSCWLEGLPDGFCNLTKLSELKLDYCHHLHSLPENIGNLSSLELLSFRYNSGLTSLPSFPCKLRSLNFDGCSRLQTISGLDSLKELENLDICECGKLQELKGLEGLERLRGLTISDCSSLRSALSGLGAMRSLQRLRLYGSPISPPMNLLEMPSLQHVSLYGSKMPECFRNCMVEQIVCPRAGGSSELMTVPIPKDITRSGFMILLCLVWYNDGKPWSCTSFKGILQTNDTFVAEDVLYSSGYGDRGNKVAMIMLRPECSLLRYAKVQDKLQIWAKLDSYEWEITMQASYKVVYGGTELQNIVSELPWGEKQVELQQEKQLQK